MKIRLKQLRLSNFMGAQSETYLFGDQTNIFGTNGSGKTTIATAFTYLFFGKDIYGKKDFAYKPLTPSGEPIHNLTTEVEGILEIDDKDVILLRRSTEKWVKPRGSEFSEYTGDETAYFINEVPSKQGDYVKYVDSIVNEDLFRLITSTSYFNGLKWSERRSMLMTLSGEKTDREVIDSNPELKQLIEPSERWTMADYKKVIADRIKKLKNDRDTLPSRIDEVMKSIVEIDYSETERRISELNKQLSEIDAQINSGSGTGEQQKTINEKMALVNKSIRELVKEIDDLTENKKSRVEREISNLKYEIDRLNRNIDGNKRMKETADKEVDKLRSERDKIKEEAFVAPSKPDCCPTCGQDFPAHLQADIVDKAMKVFTDSKIERINSKNAIGKMTMQKAAEFGKMVLDDEAVKDRKQSELDKLLETGTALTFEEINLVNAKQEQLSGLYAEVNKLNVDAELLARDPNVSLIESKQTIQAEINALNKIIGQKEFMESQKARVIELETSEKGITDQLMEAERDDYLLQIFSRTKAKLMESEINQHFEYVSFRLFDVLKNGNIEECCDVLVNGVDWSNTLNTGAKINAGLDIIRTFNRVKNVFAPVFIDNSEAVVETLPMDTQVIKLIVSEADKKLRFS